jgi:hypothetical protein
MALIQLASWSIDKNGCLAHFGSAHYPVGMALNKDIDEYPRDFFQAKEFGKEFMPSVNDLSPDLSRSLFNTLAELHKRQRSGEVHVTSPEGKPPSVKAFNDIQFKVKKVGFEELQSIDIVFKLDGKTVQSLNIIRMPQYDGTTKERTFVYAIGGKLEIYAREKDEEGEMAAQFASATGGGGAGKGLSNGYQWTW